MKTRQGFVSNSSSSNFIVFCREAAQNEIGNPNVYFHGEWVCEGEDFFKLSSNPEIVDYLKAHPEVLDTFSRAPLLYVYKIVDDDSAPYGLYSFKLFDELKVKMEQDLHTPHGMFLLKYIKKDYYPSEFIDTFITKYDAIRKGN